MTVPRASRTACEVKFSDGMRLMKCFWRFFSYTAQRHQYGLIRGRETRRRTCSMILKTAGSACSRWEDKSCQVGPVSCFPTSRRRQLGQQTCCWPSSLMDDDALVATHGLVKVAEAAGLAMPRSTRGVPRRPDRSNMTLVSGGCVSWRRRARRGGDGRGTRSRRLEGR